MLDVRPEDMGKASAQKVTSGAGTSAAQCVYITCDVSRSASVAAAVEAAAAQLGEPDILVNNGASREAGRVHRSGRAAGTVMPDPRDTLRARLPWQRASTFRACLWTQRERRARTMDRKHHLRCWFDVFSCLCGV